MTIDSVTDSTFEEVVLGESKAVLLDIWAPWCGPCKMVGPAAEKVIARRAEDMKLVMANMEEFSATSKELNVRATPTLILFKDGSEVARRSGAVMESQIEQWVEECFPS